MDKIDVVSEAIATLGFPIFMVVLLVYFMYKMMSLVYEMIVKSKDEYLERENTLREEAGTREEKLMVGLNNQANILKEISMTLQSSNEINRELGETNKQLASKIDDINEKLINIDNKVDSIINRK